MDNKTYYVDCTGNQALRDELLDYAVARGATDVGMLKYKHEAFDRLPLAFIAISDNECGVYGGNFAAHGTPITPATWKRKVRKTWGGAKTKKAAAKPVNAKDIHPTTLKALNMHSNARHSVLRDGLTAMEGRIMDHIEEVRAMVAKVESSVAVIRSGATFMQQLEKEAAKELGLQPVVEEPWVPKVGDLVVCFDLDGFGGLYDGVGEVMKVWPTHWQVQWPSGSIAEHSAKTTRPANAAEISQCHAAKQEEERKEKEARLVFGQAVEYQNDRGWKVATDKPFSSNTYLITKTGQARVEWARIDDLTIID
jgi:hypothetical protein